MISNQRKQVIDLSMSKILTRCDPRCAHFCPVCFSLNNNPWLPCVVCVCVCRDSLWLCALNSCTSFVAGFAVFSVLGFMSDREGVSIDTVVESGRVRKAQFRTLLLSGALGGPFSNRDFWKMHVHSSFLRQMAVTE